MSAALAEHIRSNAGGNVIGVFALSGRQYNAYLRLSNELLGALREKFGDVEQDFVQATGYGFYYLTESEARALVSFRTADAVRNHIIAIANEKSRSLGQAGTSEGSGSVLKLRLLIGLCKKDPIIFLSAKLQLPREGSKAGKNY